ncbi:MAG: hypothetical protein EZS28_050835, partial [Streblomastix strix]
VSIAPVRVTVVQQRLARCRVETRSIAEVLEQCLRVLTVCLRLGSLSYFSNGRPIGMGSSTEHLVTATHFSNLKMKGVMQEFPKEMDYNNLRKEINMQIS